ncbi:MAG TPA: DNA internalization-related competence protein ComEC/Rec2 [Gemmatimonadaceae bacterium]|nr:DNA internalization-related competence protein ComEC/Rec2 [Gemmatimonadaceae bacterium]
MPLVAWALGAYIAGLYAGFSAAPLLIGVALAASALAGVIHARTAIAGLVAACLAGVFMAQAAVRADANCLRAVQETGSADVVLQGDASPGAFVRAGVDGCGATISISIVSGEAMEGSHATVHGIALRGDRGVVLQHASIAMASANRPGLLNRLRAAAGHAIDDTFGSDAPLVRALLIADRHEIAPEVRDRFAAAGLAHILAIAGLHIGIIGLAFSILLELLGVSRRTSSIATIGAIVVYVAIIGAPVPAVRSATMLSVLLATRLMQRPTSRWAIVALGAAHAVLDARVVLEVGYQLSVVGVSSMIAAGMLGRRLGLHRWRPFPKAAALTLLGTTVATIGSAPIVALAFGRVSLIAPLSNLVATPLIALAQPMILAGLLVSPIAPVAHYIADAAHPLLAGLNGVATLSASIPWASVGVAPSAAAAVIAAAMSACVIVACASREWRRPATLAAVAATTLAWLPFAPSRAGLFEIHMIDVGQGDAIALHTPHGHWIVVDAGRAWRGGDAGRSTVVPYIGLRGGDVDEFILSHPHTDHVGGAATVLQVLRPRIYVDAGFPGPAESYRASLSAARDVGVRWQRAHPGDTATIDGVSLRILAPDSAWTAHLVDPNLASVIVLVQYGAVRMLMMGDAERPEEEWLLAHERDALHADILKVGHHGSSTSSSPEFLTAVTPRLALVSVGAGNSYHLPTPSVMHRLAAQGAGAQVLRTDHLGTIVVRTDGDRILIDAAGDEWELPPRSNSLGTR